MAEAAFAGPGRDAGSTRRECILEIAEQLFAGHGYHGVALARIASEAGLGNAGLIHHFASKAKLYRAVLERVAADLETRLGAALAEASGPDQRLRAFVLFQIEWMSERPQAFRLIQRELIDNRERVASARSLPLKDFLATGKEIIMEAQAAGLIAAGPPELRLNLLIGAMTYAGLVRPTFRQMLDADLLASDRTWFEAVAEDVLDLVTGQTG